MKLMPNAVFFKGNINSSFYHEESNITERPICAEKETYDCIYLAALYSTMQLVSHITTIADLIIIPLLVYLSIAKVKDGLFKYFTLNLMAICSMMTTADLVVDIIDIVVMFVKVNNSTKYLLVLLSYQIQHFARHFLTLGNIWFHALALYAAVICYLPYANPIFYTKHFVNKSQKLHYVILHISLLLWNSCMYFIKEQFSIVMPYHLTHLILFTALFTVAVMVKSCKFLSENKNKEKKITIRLNYDFDAIIARNLHLPISTNSICKLSLKQLFLQASVEIYKYKPLGVNAICVGKLRRKRLFSFIIYSYATEIIVLPLASLVLVICASIRCQRQIRGTVFYSVMNVIIRIFYESSSIAIGLSTIVALEPYRHAILSIFQKQSLSITKVQPINAVNVDNINNIAMFVHSNIAMLKTKNVIQIYQPFIFRVLIDANSEERWGQPAVFYHATISIMLQISSTESQNDKPR
ncbi:unnamed protein product [Wuchereria bancrofti]|uniref:Uncharacterized protein n=3 Tax=Wuchereria bancrofti TaxID=6293 RepID=A0A3P7DY49_WUCBA|nr:unnamed protein product [Wuchereria bancrofti]